MKNNETIITPVGRFIAGNLFKPYYSGELWDKGPDKGKPRPNYYLGVAFEKASGCLDEVRKQLHALAIESFPDKFDKKGNLIVPKFSFKIEDGDSTVPNSKGKKNCDKPGYPGNWILNFSSNYTFPITTQDGKNYITDEALIKRGYYIRVAFKAKSNFRPDNPGIKLYQQAVIFFDVGEEIHAGIDVANLLGNNTVSSLPAGVGAVLEPGESIPSGSYNGNGTPTPASTPAPINNFLNPGQ